MDVVNDIEILETDVKDCNEKCQRVNCNAIYDAIMSSLKLLYDLIFHTQMQNNLYYINKYKNMKRILIFNMKKHL